MKLKRSKILALVISIFVITIVIASCSSNNELLVDNNLETAVRDSLGLLLGEKLTTDNLSNIVRLSAEDSNIKDLSGLEYCINLFEADLSYNKIIDISPIIFLENLITLNLQENQITQIPTACTLPSIVSINLSGNQISDISPLGNLRNLGNLSIGGNRLTDISPLASSFNLTSLNLSGNQISDISPLLENGGLGEGDRLILENNNLDLTEGSVDMQNIQTLQDRGVEVSY